MKFDKEAYNKQYRHDHQAEHNAQQRESRANALAAERRRGAEDRRQIKVVAAAMAMWR